MYKKASRFQQGVRRGSLGSSHALYPSDSELKELYSKGNIRKKKRRKKQDPFSSDLESAIERLGFSEELAKPPVIDPFIEESNANAFSRERREYPTPAEKKLARILNELSEGRLRRRFVRKHVANGKWIIDFFFKEVRLAIEVDGSFHDSLDQKRKDAEKDKDLRKLDITLLRLSNADVFGEREALLTKLRNGWRQAKRRKNRIIGKKYVVPFQKD